MNNGNVNNNNKTNTNRVRAVAPAPVAASVSSATSSSVYGIPFSSIIEAWIDCERNKRSSNSCVKFCWHAARDLVALWDQMRSGTYVPKASMCFMVSYPVLREVWAAAFRDRVAHHWEHLRYQPILEEFFIEVGDRSMNCRKGYGSLRAVQTFSRAIYDFTEGYTRNDCYIVGGDFANFFMSADKHLIWPLLEELMVRSYDKPDLHALLYMMRTTMFHRCQDNFYRRSPLELWENLPHRKSLFYLDGLPIGNLPSQNWMNFVGALATAYAVHKMKLAGFIIFVDDWRCLVRSLEEGRRVIAEFRKFLAEELHITLHPNKIYLQHYTKGCKMVGAVIKPSGIGPSGISRIKEMGKWVSRAFAGKFNARKFARFLLGALRRPAASPKVPRIYIANRTRGHFIDSMRKFNAMPEAQSHAGRIALLEKLRASVNSYLGMMIHFKSYKVRKNVCERYILPVWREYLYFTGNFGKCVIKAKYNRLYIVRKPLKNHDYAARFIRPKWTPKE